MLPAARTRKRVLREILETSTLAQLRLMLIVATAGDPSDQLVHVRPAVVVGSGARELQVWSTNNHEKSEILGICTHNLDAKAAEL